MTDFFAQRGYTEDLGFKGLSFYQGSNVIWRPLGHYIAKLLDKIGLKDVDWTPEKIQEKYGVIGEPAVLGFIMGVLMGIGAGSTGLTALCSVSTWQSVWCYYP